MTIFTRTFALATALSLTAATLPAFAAPVPQDEHHDQEMRDNAGQHTNNGGQRDYSSNAFYQTGNREGYQDYQRHKKLTHKHVFQNNDDRAAYESGYNQGWSGQQYTHDNHTNDRNNPQ